MVRPLKLKFNDARNHAFQRIHIHPNDVSNIIKRQTEHGSYQYRYDHLDRLSQAEIARYSYDPFGRRIRKTVSQSGGQNGTSTPLGTITYLYADEDLLAEADTSGNITTTYGWIPNGIWGTAPQWKADVTLGSNGNTTPAAQPIITSTTIISARANASPTTRAYSPGVKNGSLRRDHHH